MITSFIDYLIHSWPIDCLTCFDFIHWLIDGLIDWLINWLIVSLIDCLLDWLIDCLIVWLIDWLFHCLIAWLIDWLIDWYHHRHRHQHHDADHHHHHHSSVAAHTRIHTGIAFTNVSCACACACRTRTTYLEEHSTTPEIQHKLQERLAHSLIAIASHDLLCCFDWLISHPPNSSPTACDTISINQWINQVNQSINQSN